MFEGTDMQSLCETLKQLATDGNKYRAKKDRRQQRSSFRDILHTVEEEESPYVQVRFGQESIIIDSWARKRHYDTLCHLLSPGVNVHLQVSKLGPELLIFVADLRLLGISFILRLGAMTSAYIL